MKKVTPVCRGHMSSKQPERPRVVQVKAKPGTRGARKNLSTAFRGGMLAWGDDVTEMAKQASKQSDAMKRMPARYDCGAERREALRRRMVLTTTDPEGAEDSSELDPDVAAAHNGDLPRLRLKCEEAIRCHAEVGARDGRHPGASSYCHSDVRSCQPAKDRKGRR